MKWILILGLIASIAPLSGWLRANDRLAPWVWTLLGFLPFVVGTWNLEAAPISWRLWPGYVKGVDVSLLDAVALAVLLSRGRTGPTLHILPLILVYLGCALLSAFYAATPMASLFLSWQILRMMVLFLAIVSICDDPRAPLAVIRGAAVGVMIQGGYALADSLSGALQTGGGLGHQNLLGLVSHFVAFPALALCMARRGGWLPVASVFAVLVVAILGASRATIGFAAIGVVLVMATSMLRGMTGSKGAVVAAGAACLAISAPFAMNSLERRFEAVPLSGEYDERAAFEKAAWMIINDHPMGIGANQYVVKANVEGYSERAGVIPSFGSRSAHVHNAYLLLTAELGFLGLTSFLLLIGRGLFLAFSCAFRNPTDLRGDIALGLGVSLIIVSVHSLYEWIIMLSVGHAMLAVALGLICGIARETRQPTASAAASDPTERKRPAVAGIPIPPVASEVARRPEGSATQTFPSRRSAALWSEDTLPPEQV